MAKGKRGPRPSLDKTAPKSNGHDKPPKHYKCDQGECPFTTPNYEEMTEHLSGTGHLSYKEVEPQNDLFKEPAPIFRKLKTKLTDAEWNELNATAGRVAIQLVEQREIATMAKERAKALEADQNEIVAKLRDPHKLADVQCEWKINMEENSKTLVRMDTQEIIQTSALSEEDRANELKRVEQLNAAPTAEAATA